MCAFTKNKLSNAVKSLTLLPGLWTISWMVLSTKDQTIYANTPERNGVAEQKNRHLIKVACSLMFTMNIPKFLRGNSVKIATYYSIKCFFEFLVINFQVLGIKSLVELLLKSMNLLFLQRFLDMCALFMIIIEIIYWKTWSSCCQMCVC